MRISHQRKRLITFQAKESITTIAQLSCSSYSSIRTPLIESSWDRLAEHAGSALIFVRSALRLLFDTVGTRTVVTTSTADATTATVLDGLEAYEICH